MPSSSHSQGSSSSSSSSEDRGLRDIVVFLLLASPLIVFFLLTGFNTANEETVVAYAVMITVSAIALVFMDLYLLEDRGKEEPVEFDRNAGFWGLVLGVFIGILVLIINVLILSFGPAQSLLPPFVSSSSSSNALGLKAVSYQSILYVPSYFSQVGQSGFPVLQNSVFELVLTAPGEEAFKASFIYGLYAKTRNEPISVIMSVLVWASFHTILVGFTWFEVALAFMSGIIFYIGWRVTGSILTAIFAHGEYDALIVIISFVGSLGSALYSDALLGIILVVEALATFYVLRRLHS